MRAQHGHLFRFGSYFGHVSLGYTCLSCANTDMEAGREASPFFIAPGAFYPAISSSFEDAYILGAVKTGQDWTGINSSPTSVCSNPVCRLAHFRLDDLSPLEVINRLAREAVGRPLPSPWLLPWRL